MKQTRKFVCSVVSLLLLIGAAVVFTQCGGKELPQLGKDPVKKVIAAMTLEEKAYLVVGTGMRLTGLPDGVTLNAGTGAFPGAGITGSQGSAFTGPGSGTQGQLPAAGNTNTAGQPVTQQGRTMPGQENLTPEQIQQLRQQYGGQRRGALPAQQTGTAPADQMQPVQQQYQGQTEGTMQQNAPSQEQIQQMRQQYGEQPGGAVPPQQPDTAQVEQMQPTQQQYQGQPESTMQESAPAQEQIQQTRPTGEAPSGQPATTTGTPTQGTRQFGGQRGGNIPSQQQGTATGGQTQGTRQFGGQGGSTAGQPTGAIPQEQTGAQQPAGQQATPGAAGRPAGTQIPSQGQTSGTQTLAPGQVTQAFGGQSATDTITKPETVVADSVERVQGAAGSTYSIPRLGIPSIVLADGPAGLRISPEREGSDATYYCTAFPVSTLLASTWDAELVYKVGEAMGNEVLEYGADILLAPALNIHRNPLTGRNFEYFSEDPLLAGKLAAAYVNGVESQGVGTSIKHFAANNAETNRMALNTIVSERALREIYLEGFRIVVQEAQPWTVMSSYNLINGTHASENSGLLTTILRDDWGFSGFVMTDWMGGTNPVAQMTAGNDLLMPGNETQAKAIIAAVLNGTLDVKILDRNVERILNIILQTPAFRKYQASNKPDLDAHAQVARQAAAEGMVLLKNTNATLPLSGIKNIAAFGNTSYKIITGGTGSGDVNEAYSVSLTEGLSNGGFNVHNQIKDLYTKYLEVADAGRPRGGLMSMFGGAPPVPEMKVAQAEITKAAAESDIALITIGRNSGEGRDRTNTEGDFLLSADELNLIKSVTSAFRAQDKNTVVILNIGGVIETASWKNIPDAILLAWQGGQETGNAITDILSGKVNPSGRLATTFPLKYEDVPSSSTFPGKITESDSATAASPQQAFPFMSSRTSEITYEDGIYVGYRFYETFGFLPSYEFGYGLSYTDFTYNNLNLSSKQFKDKITVSVDITNSGYIAGREVVQLYLSAPDIMTEKPERELKGFAKTGLLKPGETQTIIFDITPRMLASFSTPQSSWVAESGTYDVRIGASTRDIRVENTFELEGDIVVEKVNKALSPSAMVNEISIR